MTAKTRKVIDLRHRGQACLLGSGRIVAPERWARGVERKIRGPLAVVGVLRMLGVQPLAVRQHLVEDLPEWDLPQRARGDRLRILSFCLLYGQSSDLGLRANLPPAEGEAPRAGFIGPARAGLIGQCGNVRVHEDSVTRCPTSCSMTAMDVPEWQERLRSKPYVSVEEAGHLLGVGRGTSYSLVREGVLPAHRYGRLLRVPTQPLIELMLRQGAHDGRDPAVDCPDRRPY